MKDEEQPPNPTINTISIPGSAIRPLGTLHLTIGVMSLLSLERVDGAVALLKSLDLRRLLVKSEPSPPAAQEGVQIVDLGTSAPPEHVSKKAPLSVKLRGLSPMQSPSKTSSLYASPVDLDQRLQSFCEGLRVRFKDYITDQRPLKLHATIINMIYVRGREARATGPGHRKSRARLTIDARDLIKKYKDFEWASNIRLDKICICRMGAQKRDDGDEEYAVEAEVDLP